MTDNLIFNPDSQRHGFDSNEHYNMSPKSKMAEFIIKLSGGKLDENKANFVLLTILGIIIISTIIIILTSFNIGKGKPSNQPISPADPFITE